MATTDRVVIGMDPHKQSVTIEVMGAEEDVLGSRRSVGVYVDEGEALPGGGYNPSAHSAYVIAVNAEGEAPAFWGLDTSPSQFADDIGALLDD